MAGLLAFAVAVTLTPVVTFGLRRLRIVDLPGDRSSHAVPTPRGGGLAVAIAVLVAVAASPHVKGPLRTSLVLAGAALGLVGLLEDLVGIPALRRLPLLFVAAVASLPWLLDDLGGAAVWRITFGLVVLVWLVAYVNAFNFMDGINGIAAGQAVVAGLAWSWIGYVEDLPGLTAIGLIIAGAALGFAPHNVPRAKVFLGDVGSYFLGGVLACTAVIGVRAGVPVEAVLAPLSLFLADTGVTLVRRIARGQRWYEAHREHAYQRLTTYFSGSHSRTTMLVVVLMAVCAALGALSLLGTPARLFGDVAVVSILVVYVTAPSLLGGARGRRPALA